jgi:hypothetical protein
VISKDPTSHTGVRYGVRWKMTAFITLSLIPYTLTPFYKARRKFVNREGLCARVFVKVSDTQILV